MAAAIYNQMTGTSDAFSAGTYVGAVDAPRGGLIKNFFQKEDFFQVMEENNLSLRGSTMEKVSPELMNKAEVIVSMAEEPFIPDFLKNSKNVIWWDVDNPKFVDRAVAVKTFKQIYKLTEGLVANLT